jgi:hypothetical protein
LHQVVGAKEPIQVSSCEENPRKQRFIQHVVHPLTEADSCLFSNIVDMGQRRADCVAHGRRCRVRNARIGSCGFSCKNLSKKNAERSSRSDYMQAGVGSTGITCDGMLLYLDHNDVACFFHRERLGPDHR